MRPSLGGCGRQLLHCLPATNASTAARPPPAPRGPAALGCTALCGPVDDLTVRVAGRQVHRIAAREAAAPRPVAPRPPTERPPEPARAVALAEVLLGQLRFRDRRKAERARRHVPEGAIVRDGRRARREHRVLHWRPRHCAPPRPARTGESRAARPLARACRPRQPAEPAPRGGAPVWLARVPMASVAMVVEPEALKPKRTLDPKPEPRRAHRPSPFAVPPRAGTGHRCSVQRMSGRWMGHRPQIALGRHEPPAVHLRSATVVAAEYGCDRKTTINGCMQMSSRGKTFGLHHLVITFRPTDKACLVHVVDHARRPEAFASAGKLRGQSLSSDDTYWAASTLRTALIMISPRTPTRIYTDTHTHTSWHSHSHTRTGIQQTHNDCCAHLGSPQALPTSPAKHVSSAAFCTPPGHSHSSTLPAPSRPCVPDPGGQLYRLCKHIRYACKAHRYGPLIRHAHEAQI